MKGRTNKRFGLSLEQKILVYLHKEKRIERERKIKQGNVFFIHLSHIALGLFSELKAKTVVFFLEGWFLTLLCCL